MSVMQRTAKNTALLSSPEVARILGVNVATVKRWTDSGKLDCVKTAGGHRKFSMKQIAAFAKDNQKYAQRLSLVPLEDESNRHLSQIILDADFEALVPIVQEKAIACEQSEVQMILNSAYMVHQDLAILYDDLITPVLHRIGFLWANGEITISEEHLASQVIRDSIVRLQDVVNHAPAQGKSLVLTMSEELHDIAAKMIQHVLEQNGFRVLFSGPQTPVLDTEKIFSSLKPDRVYLSSTYVEDIDGAQSELEELVRLCQVHNAKLYAGGTGLNQLDLTEVSEQIHFLFSFRQTSETCK
ncbi:MAG: helix-turn-helix domain-containing protein [Candidatus Marinimicrobia bacterium]|nr:helix-turn-helix domain-containing protein [Candidatus Neomarinimicrobiota bacterium]MCF7850204.1 helix-turn-helix domain-containing protein [Candidatus Neomarinimicrobiota bacterium]MCF7903754.1 helix-turn-helix domain-containing protein [Candidatus Neomarinimicrobiota bacterium]